MSTDYVTVEEVLAVCRPISIIDGTRIKICAGYEKVIPCHVHSVTSLKSILKGYTAYINRSGGPADRVRVYTDEKRTACRDFMFSELQLEVDELIARLKNRWVSVVCASCADFTINDDARAELIEQIDDLQTNADNMEKAHQAETTALKAQVAELSATVLSNKSGLEEALSKASAELEEAKVARATLEAKLTTIHNMLSAAK